MKMEIPFCKPSVGKEEADAAAKVIESGWMAAGVETEAFEQEFAKYVGVRYAIFTNSCTSALKMAVKYYVEENNNETTLFLYPKNTFCATYAAVEETPHAYAYHKGLVDNAGRYAENYCDKKITMHYGGVKDETPCDIEDSAHRIEKNDPLTGDIRCYSFYATKNLTTGSGGMFVTNRKEIYERARTYWRDGLTTSTADRAKGTWNYDVVTMAGGYDGNDIGAAIGRVQLRKLPTLTRRRNQIVSRYNKQLAQSWTGNHIYPYFVESVRQVNGLLTHLKDAGISGGYHYPGTDWTGVSLPLYPELKDEEVDYVCQKVKEWQELQN